MIRLFIFLQKTINILFFSFVCLILTNFIAVPANAIQLCQNIIYSPSGATCSLSTTTQSNCSSPGQLWTDIQSDNCETVICKPGRAGPPDCLPEATTCTNNATNPPQCDIFPPPETCGNGATNPPTCSIFNPCTNGANNPPSCNTCNSGEGYNGSSCQGLCPAANFPACDTCNDTQTTFYGVLFRKNDPPTCSTWPACTNGALTTPSCSDCSSNQKMHTDNTCYAFCGVHRDNSFPACDSCDSGYTEYNGTCGFTCNNGAYDHGNCKFCNAGQSYDGGSNSCKNDCPAGVTGFPSCNVCANGANNPTGGCNTYDPCLNDANNPPTCNSCASGFTMASGVCKQNCPGGVSNFPACNSCDNGATNPQNCNAFPSCGNGANNYPNCDTYDACGNQATNPPICNMFPNCSNGANNSPACNSFPPCANGANNPPSCDQGLSCSNGATNPPYCNTYDSCGNGTTNPPSCNACGQNQIYRNDSCECSGGLQNFPACNACSNGTTNPPACTQFDPCFNGANNPPSCNTYNNCDNGAINPPTCSYYPPPANCSDSKVTNPPSCLTCVNGANNAPNCDSFSPCGNGAINPPTCSMYPPPDSCSDPRVTNPPGCNVCVNGGTNPPNCDAFPPCGNGALNPPTCNNFPGCTNGADNAPLCNNFPPCSNTATNSPTCDIFNPCTNGALNPPYCNNFPGCGNGANNPPQCDVIPPCGNSATNPPSCDTFNPCGNGAVNPPYCNSMPGCTNGANNPPQCTVIPPCGNEATNPPQCDIFNPCTNGAINPPYCNQFPQPSTCTNSALTNFPTCNICINGSTNPPNCTSYIPCINGAANPPFCNQFPPLETIASSTPADISYIELPQSVKTQLALKPLFSGAIKEGNRLLLFDEVLANKNLVTTVVDPRFGVIEPLPKKLDATGELVPNEDAEKNRKKFVKTDPEVNLNTIITNTNVEIPTSIYKANINAPSVENGGKIIGSKIAMSISGTGNPFSEIPSTAVSGRTTQDQIQLRLSTTCYATNLRGVGNPISATAKVTLSGEFSLNKSNFKSFSVDFPARAMFDSEENNTEPVILKSIADLPTPTLSDFNFNFTGLETTKIVGRIENRLLVLTIPSVTFSSVDMNTGNISDSKSLFIVRGLKFTQKLTQFDPILDAAELKKENIKKSELLSKVSSYNNYLKSAETYLVKTGVNYWIGYEDWKKTVLEGSYMGKAGDISTTSDNNSGIHIDQSNDGKILSISASIPGDYTICHGYHSPLMLFFDEKRPNFLNHSSFKMKHDEKTYWPEKNHTGYFLALKNKNGKIESYKDLFGESDNFESGFENLAQHDLNKDGFIDSNDSIFNKLVLWKDSTGKGLFLKKDAVLLAKKVKFIKLKYINKFETIDAGAEFRQRGSFEFNFNGKNKSGEIIDVWLKPYSKRKSVGQ